MKFAVLLAVMAVSSVPVSAQEVAGFTCSEFGHNADGSWSTLQPIQAQANSVGTGEKIIPGVFVGGMDLGARLNQTCPH